MERNDLELAAGTVVVAASDAAGASAAAVVTAPEAAAAAAALVDLQEAVPAASAGGDDEGTLELLAEVVEKTEKMTMKEHAAADAAASVVEKKEEDAGRLRLQISHVKKPADSDSDSKVPVLALPTTPTKKKKLLVLNLNGLLADINQDLCNAHLSHGKFRGKLVFKRPFCDDFLKFCFCNFDVGLWSSRMRHNVDAVVDIVMKGWKDRLLFCWDASKCTATGLYTLENKNKPLVLKELKKLWSKDESADGVPRQQGDFSASNTLLLDHTPYKALRNPPHTAIFPCPYSYKNKDDSSLGPGGDIRLYLESLATADDVPSFVRKHPFGQPPISESDPNWKFYKKILLE